MPKRHLAFVLLPEPRLPRGSDVAQAFRDIAPKEGGLVAEEADGALTCALTGGATLLVGLLPMPVPNGEADDAARRSVNGILQQWSPKKHAAHLVVSLSDGEGATPLDGLKRFVAATAAVAQAAGAVGIYCGEAHATYDPRFFIEVASEPDTAGFLTVCVGVDVAADGESRVSLLSFGMAQFGMSDLRITAPRAAFGQAYEMLYDLLSYAVRRGEVIPEGETVGRSDSERLPVRHEPSPIDPKRTIWRVDLP